MTAFRKIVLLLFLSTALGCGSPDPIPTQEEPPPASSSDTALEESERARLQGLMATYAEAGQAQAELEKVEILEAHFLGVKETKRILLSVRNGTSHALKALYFDAELVSPGRSVPWVEDTFHYEVPGGLEPGEKQEWLLKPNILSNWNTTATPPQDAEFKVRLIRVDGADGEVLFEASGLSPEDDELMRSLAAKYEVAIPDRVSFESGQGGAWKYCGSFLADYREGARWPTFENVTVYELDEAGGFEVQAKAGPGLDDDVQCLVQQDTDGGWILEELWFGTESLYQRKFETGEGGAWKYCGEFVGEWADQAIWPAFKDVVVSSLENAGEYEVFASAQDVKCVIRYDGSNWYLLDLWIGNEHLHHAR